jgi:hypothetical protein
MVPLLSFRTFDNLTNCHLFPISNPGYSGKNVAAMVLQNGLGMAEYRVYTIGTDGHIVQSTPLVCDDDGQAIEQARKIGEGQTLEIWSGERFVAQVPRER